MATINLQGSPIETVGNLPNLNEKAPEFVLTASDLSEKKLSDFSGSKLVLNIFPSVDTGTCATSVKEFNKKASALENTKVLCVSKDLPFAQARFCGAENIENIVMLSDFRDSNFGKEYGLEITTGPLKNLHSRCIVVINENGNVVYTEQVDEIVNEPNYEEALKAI